jgi:hypothetical protein
VAANSSRVGVHEPVSNHIDEVLGRKLERAETIPLSLRAFTVLVDEIGKLAQFVQPMLSIPLTSESNKLSAAVPQDFQSMMEEWRDREPPSLYLLDWELPKYLYSYEEYRRPLPFHLFSPPIPGVDEYYNEFRFPPDIESDWDYVRSVNAKYYPDRYRF